MNTHTNPWKDVRYLKNGTPRQQQAWESLNATNVLELLSKFEATLVGTVPIDVDIPTSDLDILCFTDDIPKFSKMIEGYFGHFPAFLQTQVLVNEELTVITSFEHSSFPYEVFAQAVPVTRQTAYLHMITEARLLAGADPQARKAIRELKLRGLKTEPAFAEYFKIKGDPYTELLRLASGGT